MFLLKLRATEARNSNVAARPRRSRARRRTVDDGAAP